MAAWKKQSIEVTRLSDGAYKIDGFSLTAEPIKAKHRFNV